MTSILGPSARPVVQLGGQGVAWKTRTLHGIFCSFQWVDLRPHGFEDTPDHAAVPCMVLFRPSVMDAGAFVIPQHHAYLYGDKHGNPTAQLAIAAFSAREQLNFGPQDKGALKLIMDIVIEGLPDLILMPSDPPAGSDAALKRQVIGIEAEVKVGGKSIVQDVL